MSVVEENESLAKFAPAGEEPYGEWELPGMGEPGSDCGVVSAVGFCDSHGHIQYRNHQCGRRSCPKCWSDYWAENRTVSVVSRLAAARYSEPDGRRRRLVHAVVSPEEEIRTIEGFYQARSKANEIAKEHGVRGGVTVAHGYRVKEEVQDEYRSKDAEGGLWMWIRRNERDWTEQVYWSPHFHIIGLATDFEAGEERSDGWIVHKIRSLERYEGMRDRSGTEDMVRTVRYILSHTTYPAGENRQSVTWFGDLHGTNFSPEGELSEGAWSVIQRVTEEIVGTAGEIEEESGPGGETEECRVEDCEGKVHDIWHARRFLNGPAGQELSREERERVRVTYEWVAGIREPPPGAKRPRTIEEAEESLSLLLSQ
jgi:hypothetical protein